MNRRDAMKAAAGAVATAVLPLDLIGSTTELESPTTSPMTQPGVHDPWDNPHANPLQDIRDAIDRVMEQTGLTCSSFTFISDGHTEKLAAIRFSGFGEQWNPSVRIAMDEFSARTGLWLHSGTLYNQHWADLQFVVSGPDRPRGVLLDSYSSVKTAPIIPGLTLMADPSKKL